MPKRRTAQDILDEKAMSKTHYIDIPAQPIPEPNGSCRNCHQRPATERWIGDGGSLALTHGHYQFWCRLCALQAQLDYAKERAAAIPDLERELSMLHDEMERQ